MPNRVKDTEILIFVKRFHLSITLVLRGLKMLWLSHAKRNDAAFRVIEIILSFDTVTVAYIHKHFEKRRV